MQKLLILSARQGSLQNQRRCAQRKNITSCELYLFVTKPHQGGGPMTKAASAKATGSWAAPTKFAAMKNPFCFAKQPVTNHRIGISNL